ncbi:T9SS type A sorting domain-containing protein [Algibacter miyuki]|uniref:T9SS type A sorting domain-containing protein n=1 Tax=Algibacter miyuki TaxID=1306933 RepID=A0ABV5H2U9_9FLAO|nr:T9SS type A sorting domain-containing protein [Algibacter miyuki]MDN3663913.1 T9SS type A sorting domain-containing protein [Algibacter miyuki]
MNKFIPVLFFMLFFFQISNAQFLWYENESNNAHLEYLAVSNGTFSTDVSNPDNTGINTKFIVSRFERNESTSANISFQLKSPITNISNLTISLKAHISLATEDLKNPNTRIRIYLGNSTVSSVIYIQKHFSVGQIWQGFEFNFSELEIPNDVINAGGFDILRISFINANNPAAAATYHLDSIYGSVDQTGHVAAWLSGSWGVTFPVFGGERLDSEVSGGYNLVGGAQEVVDELPAAGHIITNLSYFAHSHYFTLRGNENVDVASEIHESLVPSLANEAIIFDVMEKFKNSGKKVILYISTNYLDRADDAAHAAWVNYYTSEFAGDEYLAYKDLIQGYILRIKDYADGYWLDTTAELNDDGYIEDFVEMIRQADPSAAVSASPNGAYFTENGENILVDSDGLDDEDERDYKIVSFEGVNSYQDFTSGHVTPLGQGAPPNSWAYEEFTIPAMVANPWGKYGSKIILKHAWFPVRDKWHVSSANLMFGAEDAYRFTRTLVDAKAGVTFATTITDKGSGKGYMMAEEMAIMKIINDRLLSVPMTDYLPYVRPEGAYLVGEETLYTGAFSSVSEVMFYPNPVVDKITITRATTDLEYIKVISNLGAKVIEKVWYSGALTTQLDLSTLKPGIYFLNLSNEKNLSITRKIIISK